MSSPEIEASRQRLLEGISRFQKNVFPHRRSEYERLASQGQNPHALFLTCSDSRVDPELLTQSAPGEIFVARNIGNVVPAYGEMLGGISAVIEYSVTLLGVNQVIVCGHTDCGAMTGLLHPERVSGMPTVRLWLRNAEAALSVVQARQTAQDEPAVLQQLIEENVLLQMHHLRTHPSVAGAVAQGTLAVSGWVYDIARGEVHLYDEQRKSFVPAGRSFKEGNHAQSVAK